MKCPKCSSENIWRNYSANCIIKLNPNTKEERVESTEIKDYNDPLNYECHECAHIWDDE